MSAHELAAQLERRLQYLEADPDNPTLLAETADLALSLGQAARAQALVERALALKPDDPYLRARLASVKLTLGDAAGAADILQALLDGGETAPALRYNLAYALMLNGRYADAKPHLEAVGDQVERAPLLLVRAHHHLGELQEAIKVAEAYATTHPEDAESSGQLAMLYLDANDFTKARAWSDKALLLKAKTPEGYFTAGYIALGDEDAERAGELFASALGLNAKSGRAWAGKGLTAMMAGDLAAGEQALERAVQHMPQHIGTWLALGWCRAVSGKIDAAEQAFRSAYALDRAFSETQGALAFIELLRGGREQARRRADVALRLDPRSLAGRYARVLVEAKSDAERAEGIRSILASERALRGGTLLDMVSRHAARKPPH